MRITRLFVLLALGALLAPRIEASRTSVSESNPPSSLTATRADAAGLLASLAPAAGADAETTKPPLFNLGDVVLVERELAREERFDIGPLTLVDLNLLRGPPPSYPETRVGGFELLPPFRVGASPSLSLWGRQACDFSCREVASDSRYDPWGLAEQSDREFNVALWDLADRSNPALGYGQVHDRIEARHALFEYQKTLAGEQKSILGWLFSDLVGSGKKAAERIARMPADVEKKVQKAWEVRSQVSPEAQEYGLDYGARIAEGLSKAAGEVQGRLARGAMEGAEFYLGNKAGELALSGMAGLLAKGTQLSRAQAQRQLIQSLGPDPFAGKGQAHHLFDFAEHGSPLGLKLQQWGIDLNSAQNGVWLPRQAQSGVLAAVHRGRSTNVYKQEVFRRLTGASNRADALEALDTVRKDLIDGVLRINAAR